MKLLTIIPARGGSKRLPMKNIRQLGGKPLIQWTIDVAKKAKYISEILVSTDDEAIAEISKSNGLLVPWLRPSFLATDSSTSVEVVLHALDWYESNYGLVDGVLLLQATSPFRTVKTIEDGIKLFLNDLNAQIIGVSECDKPKDSFIISAGGYLVTNKNLISPSYEINGSFYLSSPSNLRKIHSFIGKNTTPLIIRSRKESLDIDTLEDFNMAEYLLLDEK